MKKTLTVESFGKKTELFFTAEKYKSNGNLCLQLWCKDEDYGGYEPYVTLTTNLSKRPENRALINYNSITGMERRIMAMLTDDGDDMTYASCTYYFERSGYCEYYEYKFTDKFFEEYVWETLPENN